jgi:putative FmdB family regulatory protein
MPTYAYACENCGHTFDEFQSIKAAPLRKCPECGKAALKRLIGTGAGIIFKGSGFYCTDYRSDGYKKAAQTETGGKTKSADKKEAKESKTEVKAADKADSAAPKKKSA